METLKLLVKASGLLVMVAVVMVGVIPAAAALPVDGETVLSFSAADIIPGSDIQLSSEGAAAPDIAVSSNGQFIALAYFRSNGWVHIKSATLSDGWLTTTALGEGSNPQLAFHPSTNDLVYVVWGRRDSRAIEYARCTLTAANSPSCITGIVHESTSTVENPAVVVDSSGTVHAAWTGTGGNLETAWSTNQGSTWSSPVSLASGSNNFRRAQLAFANGVLHLAYVVEDPAPNPDEGLRVEYRRATNLTNHNWSAGQPFGPGAGVFNGYNSVNFPAIAANGNNVYLAWEAHSGNNGGINNEFGLMKIESADGGVSWPAPVRYITSDASATGVDVTTPAYKTSRSSFAGSVVPLQEEGLRPSLVISGTGYAAVWQQRPSSSCGESDNGSAEIYYSLKGASWSGPDTLANNINQYSIDPDLAVNPVSKERHFVFMKDDDQVTGCQGGEASAYAIYYRGPFIIVDKDDGEDTTDPTAPKPTIYLPIIRKG